MEYNKENSTKTTIEDNYAAHEENPGPAKEAVTEKDDKKVGFTMHWVIIIAIIALIIAYFFFV